MDSIGQKIRYLRDKKDLTQGALGKRVGLSAASIGGYERDENEPPISELKKIANALGVHVAYFLVDNSEPTETLDKMELRMVALQKIMDQQRVELEAAKQDAEKWKDNYTELTIKHLGLGKKDE